VGGQAPLKLSLALCLKINIVCIVDSSYTRQMEKDDGSVQQLGLQNGRVKQDIIAECNFKLILPLTVLFRLNSNNTWLTNFIFKLEVNHIRSK
jgi:hypothetical protein